MTLERDGPNSAFKKLTNNEPTNKTMLSGGDGGTGVITGGQIASRPFGTLRCKNSWMTQRKKGVGTIGLTRVRNSNGRVEIPLLKSNPASQCISQRLAPWP